MAKWGCGDPRWIVEERADAKNVNNWHWTEKDASSWSKDKLKQLLMGMTFDTETIGVHVTDVTKIEGEATANNRKSKLIFFYEWNVIADWVAFYKPNQITVKGKLEILNLSEEHEPKDVDIDIDLVNDSEPDPQTKETDVRTANECAKDFMMKDGVRHVRTLIEEYVRQLREEYSRDIILPTAKKDPIPNGHADLSSKNVQKVSKSPTTKSINVTPPKINTSSGANVPTADKSQSLNLNIFKTKKLCQTETFMTSPEELYSIFVDPQKVAAFTRSVPRIYEAQKNGSFSIFDGNIEGQFLELVPPSKISMRWRIAFWPANHYSTVTIDIEPSTEPSKNASSAVSTLKMTQTSIPENFYEVMAEGWYKYYWRPIRDTFGYSPHIF